MTTQAPGREAQPARKVGYLVSVIINTVMLFLVNVRPGWRDDAAEVRWTTADGPIVVPVRSTVRCRAPAWAWR